MEKVQDAVSRLNKMRNRVQLYAVILLIIMTAVTIVALNIPKLGIVGAILLAVYYFGWLRRKIKEYQKEFIHQTLVFGPCKGCKDIVYDNNKNSLQALKESPMLPIEEKSEVSLWHGFTAKHDSLSMTVNEASCNFQINSSKGRQVKCITGTAVCIDKSSLVPEGSIVIYDRSILYNHTYKLTERGLHEVKELPENFDKERFIVFAPEGSQPELDVHFMDKFSSLSRKIEKPFIICLWKGQMQAFLCERFYAQKVAVKYEVTENALLGNRLPELSALLTFAG